MAKKATTTDTKSVKTNNIKQIIINGFNTLFTVVKILGSLGGGAYLLIAGIEQNNPVFMGLGAVLTAYGIIILVLTAHVATKYRVQDNTKGL